MLAFILFHGSSAVRNPLLLASTRRRLEPTELEINEDDTLPEDAPVSDDTLEIPSWGTSTAPKSRRGRQSFVTILPRDGELNLDLRSNSTDWVSHDGTISMSLDPISLGRLLSLGLGGMLGFGSALGATLRFVAPLIAARHGIYTILKTGGYLDTKAKVPLAPAPERVVEERNVDPDQLPVAYRSAGRFAAQLLSYFMLGKFMEWMIEISDSPCVAAFGGCHTICGLLWIVGVLGIGHSFGAAISVWGGPIKIEPRNSKLRRPNLPPSFKEIRENPRGLVQSLRDPKLWIRELSHMPGGKGSLRPDPVTFPTTWQSIVLLQLLTVAAEMSVSHEVMTTLMRWLLIQQTLSDEWYRLLMCEEKPGLALILASGNVLAMIRLFWVCAVQNDVSALLFIVPLCSSMVAAWMTGLVYMDSLRGKFEPLSIGENEDLSGTIASPSSSLPRTWP